MQTKLNNSVTSVLLGYLPFKEAFQTRKISKKQHSHISNAIHFSHKERQLNFNLATTMLDLDSLEESLHILNLATKLNIKMSDVHHLDRHLLLINTMLRNAVSVNLLNM